MVAVDLESIHGPDLVIVFQCLSIAYFLRLVQYFLFDGCISSANEMFPMTAAALESMTSAALGSSVGPTLL